MRITPQWIGTTEDVRAKQLDEEFDADDYKIRSENEAMRLQTNERSASPDISLASNDIALLLDWSVSTSLASDHLPILIAVISERSTMDGPRRTYISHKIADWERYADPCDEYIAEAGETRTDEQSEKTFRKTNNKASAFRPDHSALPKSMQSSVKSLADDRDRKLGLNPVNNTLND